MGHQIKNYNEYKYINRYSEYQISNVPYLSSYLSPSLRFLQ